MAQPTYILDEFRFQEDAGSDSSPSWRELSNTDTTLTVGSANKILLRFQMHNTNTRTGNEAWDWEYNLAGAGWTAITDATNVIRAAAPDTYTGDGDGGDVSNKLTSRAGTYVTNNNSYCTTGDGTVYSHTSDYYSECVLTFYIPDTVDVSQNDNIEIRIVENLGDTLDYNSLTANVTVNIPAVTINCSAGIVTATGQQATITAAVSVGGPIPALTRPLNMRQHTARLAR
jgi:hypothetical protein